MGKVTKIPIQEVFVGATSSTSGHPGLVPAPVAGVEKYLRNDGTWQTVNLVTRYNGSFLSNGWTQSTINNWYSQMVSIYGFTYSGSIQDLRVDIDMSSATSATASDLQDAWALVGRIYLDPYGLHAICYGDAPTTDIPFILSVTGG